MDRRFAAAALVSGDRFSEFQIGNAAVIGDLKGTLKLHSWVLTILVGGVFLPIIQSFFT